MATYWKSIPRKFCDFCKCWITDNKPSVDFHERGKRHQENVKKRIDEMRKKSLEKAKLDEEKESDLKKMEKAALEAFKKDLDNNPELKAMYLARAKAAKEAAKPSQSEDKKTEEPVKDVKEWYEAKSAEGYSYYWSMFTGESIWEAPDTYISIEEQDRLSQGETTPDKQVEETEIQIHPKKKEHAPEEKGQQEVQQKVHPKDHPDSPLPIDEIPLPGEVTHMPTDIPLPEEEKPAPRIRIDPKGGRQAYGVWETVQEEAPLDLDLPIPATVEEIPLPITIEEEPRHERFKEKKVTSLGSGSNVAFKKRKLASGARNVRRRDNDD